jgi:P4 family phage/plasmid primase-like protien
MNKNIMAHTCTYCYKPIKEEELYTEEPFRDINGKPLSEPTHYHKKCREEVRDATRESIERKIQQQRHDEEREAQSRIDLAMSLAKGTGYIHAATVFISEQPLYYDESKLWWIWDHLKRIWIQTDETNILNIARKSLQLIGDATVRRHTHLVEALRQVGRDNKPEELEKEWIQFGSELYNINTQERKQSDPQYFSTNTVPWELGDTTHTPKLDELFKSWVGEEHISTLKEVLAYCMYRDYPIHIVTFLNGGGRNGKSTYFRVMKKLIGEDNIASTDLERLTQNVRFETFNLYKKLVAVMGETNFAILNRTSIIKSLSGQDTIPYEPKGKVAFTGENYAKLVIASNSLPTSDDTSEGWYRRWLIIDFPNEFPEGKDILADVPDSEYNALARTCAELLPHLLSRGAFTNQGSIEERKQRYIAVSNPLSIFLDTHTNRDFDGHVRYTDLYIRYVQWLADRKQRKVTRKEFGRVLEDEGLEVRRTTVKDEFGELEKGTFVFGIKYKTSPTEFGQEKPFTQFTHVTQENPVSTPYKESRSEFRGKLRKLRISPVPSKFEYTNINNSHNIIEFLKNHGPVVKTSDLVANCTATNAEIFIKTCLEAFAQKGDIYSPEPGHWRIRE